MERLMAGDKSDDKLVRKDDIRMRAQHIIQLEKSNLKYKNGNCKSKWKNDK